MKPKTSGQPQTKPRAKQRPQQTQKITKHWNRRRNNPRQHPRAPTQRDPRAVRAHALLVHDVLPAQPVAPEPHVEVFDDDGRVDHAGDDNGGHGDAPGDFADEGAGRGQRGRVHGVADEAVDDDCDDEVEGDGGGLQQG